MIKKERGSIYIIQMTITVQVERKLLGEGKTLDRQEETNIRETKITKYDEKIEQGCVYKTNDDHGGTIKALGEGLDLTGHRETNIKERNTRKVTKQEKVTRQEEKKA